MSEWKIKGNYYSSDFAVIETATGYRCGGYYGPSGPHHEDGTPVVPFENYNENVYFSQEWEDRAGRALLDSVGALGEWEVAESILGRKEVDIRDLKEVRAFINDAIEASKDALKKALRCIVTYGDALKIEKLTGPYAQGLETTVLINDLRVTVRVCGNSQMVVRHMSGSVERYGIVFHGRNAFVDMNECCVPLADAIKQLSRV